MRKLLLLSAALLTVGAAASPAAASWTDEVASLYEKDAGAREALARASSLIDAYPDKRRDAEQLDKARVCLGKLQRGARALSGDCWPDFFLRGEGGSEISAALRAAWHRSNAYFYGWFLIGDAEAARAVNPMFLRNMRDSAAMGGLDASAAEAKAKACAAGLLKDGCSLAPGDIVDVAAAHRRALARSGERISQGLAAAPF